MKIACAMLGQGGGADLIQEMTIKLWKSTGEYPIMNVHDENVHELPAGWGDKQCWDYMQYLTETSTRLSGLQCPVKVSRGPSWGEVKEIIL